MLALMTEETQVVHTQTTWEYNKATQLYEPVAGCVEPYEGESSECAPAVAVVAAGFTIKAGIAMVATSALMGGIMIAGGVFSALGALTGNKTLSTIGGGLSLAGGIGSAFTNASTGSFINPFKEGNFGKSVLGKGLESLKSDLGFGDDAAGGVSLGQETTQNIVDTAQGGNPYDLAASADDLSQGVNLPSNALDEAVGESLQQYGVSNLDQASNIAQGAQIPADSIGQEITNQVANVGTDAVAQAVKGASGSTSGGVFGNISKLAENKGLMSAISGASDAYDSYQQREQAQPLVDARIDATEANTEGQRIANELALQRQKNMDLTGIDLDSGFHRMGRSSGNGQTQTANAPSQQQERKFVMYIDNKPVYVTEQEYIAMQQQKNGLMNS